MIVKNIMKCCGLSVLILAFGMSNVDAGWGDLLDYFSDDPEIIHGVSSVLTDSEIIDGLKEALSRGTTSAIARLGKEDGFFANRKVKILMPDSLKTVEDGLRKIGQDRYADEFVLTMNRAAEQAVPEAAEIFGSAIRNMSIQNARGILNGPDDAATKYFRRTSGEKLVNRFLPIVGRATDRVGVTSNYKEMVDKLGFMSRFFDTESLDVDRYVTNRAIDGLFLMLAREEKLIRENPASRTTELLKKVFANN
ncbi:MAG: DUF4197 domain-containing protein [Proteobacteria bacterium]|nr:DUF4197 domain-containing protein [Pseudomonadota bacterium]MCH8977271.1 DUF4197 domain-containing protein [Pseudomonadota bacterium]